MATMPRQNNNRQKIRVTKVLTVDCRVLELPPVQTGKNFLQVSQSFGGRTINLSEDGLLINTDFYLDPRTKLEILFNLPDGKVKKTIKVSAQVVRSQRNAFNLYGRYGVGLHVSQPPKEFSLLTDYFSSKD